MTQGCPEEKVWVLKECGERGWSIPSKKWGWSIPKGENVMEGLEYPFREVGLEYPRKRKFDIEFEVKAGLEYPFEVVGFEYPQK